MQKIYYFRKCLKNIIFLHRTNIFESKFIFSKQYFLYKLNCWMHGAVLNQKFV